MKMKVFLGFFAAVLFLASAGFASAEEGGKPVILWASSPAAPGETVLVHGGDFGANPKIEIKSPAETRILEPVSRSDTALFFTFPKDWEPTEARIRIVSENGVSVCCGINTPDVWWVQGDWGDEASPGGTIRVFGRGIEAPNGGREFFLVNDEGKPVSGIESQEEVNRWSQKIKLADSITEGKYRVAWIDPVLGKQKTSDEIAVRVHQEPCKPEIFDITAYGAVANDGKDDTEAVEKAMAELVANGGGVLYVPRGRFCMTKTIILPPFSKLKGVSQELSQIYWPDTEEPPAALIRGDNNFAVEDIFLTSANHLDGIVSNLKPEEYGGKPGYLKENVTLRNMTMRLLFSEFANNDLEKTKSRLAVLHYKRALILSGKFVRIQNCDIYTVAGGAFGIDAEWSEISNNKISRAGMIGWNGFNGSQLIVENNHFGGANCTSFYGVPSMSEHIYWGNNYHENCFDGNNRETMTGDGRTHFYIGKAEIVDSTTIAFDAKRAGDKNLDAWRKGVLQVAGNRGVGQRQRITRIEEKEGKVYVTVAEPWQITPNADTIFYIGTCRGKFIYTGNKAYDSSIALQLYGSMMEAVIADNLTSRTGGYHADTMNGETSWFIQLLNNTIECGNAYRGPYNEIPAVDAHIGLMANGNGTPDDDYSILLSSVIRNCKLLGNAMLEVRGQATNILLEKNLVRDADYGEKISKEAANVYQNENVFENVGKEQK